MSLEQLKQERSEQPQHMRRQDRYLLYLGFSAHYGDCAPVARAYAAASLFSGLGAHIYDSDLIAGSLRGLLVPETQLSEADVRHAEKIVGSFGRNTFWTNCDHFAPDYETILSVGIGGILEQIDASAAAHRDAPDAEKRLAFLQAAQISMQGFAALVRHYADAAAQAALRPQLSGQARADKLAIADACGRLAGGKAPQTFFEALQLVWLCHVAFHAEGRYAMALGRMDAYLRPFYEADLAAGRLTWERAVELLACTLIKIGEHRFYGGDDVVNIAIGGRTRAGASNVSPLSYAVLEAVRRCNIPGPNLSARLHEGVEDRFIDECLKVIGTGLGYPALMNDEVNIPALERHGYAHEDCLDYCMVGCIENFIPGRQPPWSDGRFNSPKYIELALNNGVCMQTGARLGPATGAPESFGGMTEFMAAVEKQMVFGAAEYAAVFLNENDRYNRFRYAQPFLSCFCRDCIARAADINDGGALYPSVHGAGCMGIATVADSLAAVERLVFEERFVTLGELRDALAADFEGYGALRARCLAAPKYGNDDDFADKYAVWYVEAHERIFSKYKTPDGGDFYIAIASNVQNISAGREIAATPDGRGNGQPLSDAASPMRGMDKNGPTAVVASVTKPDYTLVACGTVLNQKFSPSMFATQERRDCLAALLKIYFRRGGQEMQINSVSRKLLRDAMESPQNYSDLVVRVSGFSAYFTALDKAVQHDILMRTEHA